MFNIPAGTKSCVMPSVADIFIVTGVDMASTGAGVFSIVGVADICVGTGVSDGDGVLVEGGMLVL